MYRVRLKGNFNVCISDLNAIFTYNRPEKTFSDSEFENSEDIKKYLGKYLTAEHVDVKQPKASAKLHNTVKEDTPKIDVKIESVDDKNRMIIKNKEHERSSDIINADNASLTVKPENDTKDDEIVVADGASKEENKLTEEDKKSVRMDNFGNVVQDVKVNVEPETKQQEQPKIKEVKTEETKASEKPVAKKSKKKTTKISINKNDGVEKTNE